MLADILKIFIGCILGFLSKTFWDWKNKKRDDLKTFNKIYQVICELSRIPETGPLRGINTCMDDIHQLTLEVQCKRYKNIVSEFREFAKRNRYIIPMGFSPREIEEKKRFYRELKEVKKKLEEMIKKR